MTKTIISCLIACTIFISCAVCENLYLKNTFSDFEKRLEIVDQKCSNETARLDDLNSLRIFWFKKKESLHVIIPHTEIKEIDLWISEAVRLAEQNKFAEVKQKIEVIRNICFQVPKTFSIKFENIF